MVTARQWLVKRVPDPTKGFIFDFDGPDSTFDLVDKELNVDQLKEGEFLVQTLYLSNDPAQKFWIASIDSNYSLGSQKGDVVPSRNIAKVLASRNSDVKVGDLITDNIGWTTHAILNKNSAYRKLSCEAVDETWWHLSVLGSTALTAYFIFYDILELQKRESDYGKVFLISGAAGAVGSISIQLAQNVFKASKIFAIVGGSEKVKYVESFGEKVIGVDYKDENFKENLLAAVGVNTVDYFIDNVGGEILDIGIDLLKRRGTAAACGAISGYNDSSKIVLKNYIPIITKGLTLRGIILTDYRNEFPGAIEELLQLVKAGDIDVSKSATIKDATGDKFKEVPLIWNGLFRGINKGKLITRVSEE
ncbi:uncharacterized protein Ecym_5674 [Eremothecium cymbalariae DBVPG|uniref:Enoyl reductase (ER) domain-containing protein n=1 Tax=Eremothecium cymbalariae (strain CBS 270.75 / DBVPG 7215 / KCTC 17166 / NRRL Y-17582) TaxID=931890 RepID=I6NEB2_ERECY|nr:hypothetical protein Ecym_5674 [Eremothecium cymbalariae DBVPG\